MKLGTVVPIHFDLFNLTSTRTSGKSKNGRMEMIDMYLFVVPITKSQLNQRPFIRVQMVFIGEVLHVRPQRNCKFLMLITTGRIQNLSSSMNEKSSVSIYA